MNILYLLQQLPFPPSNGYKQKVWNVLGYMAQRHQCDVLALGTPEDLQRSVPWLEQLPRVRVLGVFPPDEVSLLRIRQWLKVLYSSDSPSWLRFRSLALERAVDQAVDQKRYEVAHVDLQGMAQYCQRLGELRRVLSLNDAMSLTLFGAAGNRFAPLRMRMSAFLKAWPQMRIDKACFRLADAVHFVGAYDANWCRKRFGASNAVYLPLAVESVFLNTGPKSGPSESQRLIIIDKLWASQHRNAVSGFLSKYWMILRSKHPTIRLIVVGGKGMPKTFQQYVRSLPGVELHEWVDRLEDTLAQTHIAIFPYSVKVGMKTRVLQCMAAMNAVVGTPDAFLGLPVRHKEHVFIAENQQGIVDGIEEVLGSVSYRDQMGRNARVLIQENFTQEGIGRAWEHLYEDVSKKRVLRESYGVNVARGKNP